MNGHLRQLDGIRGVAVALVVIYHSAYLTYGWGPRPFPGGFIGVDLFFALSGFLITRLLLAELGRTGGIDVARFLLRRLRRLVPALVVMVGVIIVAIPVLGGDLGGDAAWRSAAGSLAYVSNWMQAAGSPFLTQLTHTWSLSVEAQFYVAWPLLMIVAHRLQASRWVLIALTLGMAAGAGLLRARGLDQSADLADLYIRTDTRADVILLGCAAGLIDADRIGVAARNCLRVVSALAIVVMLAVCLDSETGDPRLYEWGFTVVAIGVAGLVLSAASDERWALHRVWLAWPLRALGLRSYSLYLWHVPIFILVAQHLGADRPVVLRLSVGLATAALATEVSYRLVERRFYQPSDRRLVAAGHVRA